MSTLHTRRAHAHTHSVTCRCSFNQRCVYLTHSHIYFYLARLSLASWSRTPMEHGHGMNINILFTRTGIASINCRNWCVLRFFSSMQRRFYHHRLLKKPTKSSTTSFMALDVKSFAFVSILFKSKATKFKQLDFLFWFFRDDGKNMPHSTPNKLGWKLFRWFLLFDLFIIWVMDFSFIPLSGDCWMNLSLSALLSFPSYGKRECRKKVIQFLWLRLCLFYGKFMSIS